MAAAGRPTCGVGTSCFARQQVATRRFPRLCGDGEVENHRLDKAGLPFCAGARRTGQTKLTVY
jgi:hypothetical protein